MEIRVKRIYLPESEEDGLRILVDRLWPRGVSREKARIAHWVKEIAPSKALRQWYAHDRAKWPEFKKRYFAELDANEQALSQLKSLLNSTVVTFLFSSREEKLNNAAALKEYLEQ